MKTFLFLLVLVGNVAFGNESITVFNNYCLDSEGPVRYSAGKISSDYTVDLFEKNITGAVLNNWFSGRSLVSVHQVSDSKCVYYFSSLGNEPKEKISGSKLKEEKNKILKEVIAGKHLVKWIEHKCIDEDNDKTEYQTLLKLASNDYRMVAKIKIKNNNCYYIFARNLNSAR